VGGREVIDGVAGGGSAGSAFKPRGAAALVATNREGLWAPSQRAPAADGPLQPSRRRTKLRKSLRELRLVWDVAAARLSSRPPVIVYTMGKVGTQSYRRSLKKFKRHPVLAVHYLNPTYRRELVLGRGNVIQEGSALRRLQSWLVHRLLIRSGRPCLLVAGVRDPVAQILSRFHHSSNKFWRESVPPVSDLADWFLANVDLNFPLEWFDREFLPMTGFDVYATPFDKSRGWIILERGATRCLVLKLEASNAAKEEGLRTLLGAPEFCLDNFNATGEKSSADRYRALKDRVRLPREVMDRLLASRYLRHFYDDTEAQEIRRRWQA
jgi:hypothetical protein